MGHGALRPAPFPHPPSLMPHALCYGTPRPARPAPAAAHGGLQRDDGIVRARVAEERDAHRRARAAGRARAVRRRDYAVPRLLGRGARGQLFHVAEGGRLAGGLRVPRRPALADHDAHRDRHREPHPPVLDRVHARRRRVLAVLPVPEPVHLRDAEPGAGREPRRAVPRVGGRRAVLVPAHRLLVHRSQELGRGQQGVRRQPDRRLRLPDGDVPRLPDRPRPARRGRSASTSRRCSRRRASR